MSRYARSDLMSISIPTSSGGCGATHTRPVTRGAPAKTWKLDCKPCESFLSGERKAKIIRVIPGDKELGIPSRMEHVADADPHWSITPESVPLTPDEQNINKVRAERGHQQLQQLQALAMIQGAGINVTDFAEAQWLLEQNFDKRLIQGTLVCANGHQNAGGTKFCGECGITMAATGSLTSRKNVEKTSTGEIPLEKLHVATLKKMCRERGLPDKGAKAELIKRLTIPANVKLTTEVAA